MSVDWDVRAARTAEELVAAARLFDEPVTLESAARFLAQPGHTVLLAHEPTGIAVGFVSTVVVVHPDKGPEVLIYELGVDEAWRRRGVASALLAAVRTRATTEGHRGIWVVTEPDNVAALATYRRAGGTSDDTVTITWDGRTDG